MATGTVKWFSEGTGYRSLEQGDRVEFDVVDGVKSPQAANVRRLNGGNA